MLDHVIEWGWDNRRGGFMEAGPAAEPRRRRRAAEGAQAAVVGSNRGGQAPLAVTLDEPEDGRYRALFTRCMEVIDTEFVDHLFGGWEMTARSDVPRRLHLRRRALPKSDIWKDASHEADMHLAAIRMLRGLAAEDPID